MGDGSQTASIVMKCTSGLRLLCIYTEPPRASLSMMQPLLFVLQGDESLLVCIAGQRVLDWNVRVVQ